MNIEYKPIRIAHIGSYNRNLGDNIAILNVRKEFEKSMSNIEWISLDILDIFWNRNNNIDFEAFYDFYESKDWYVGKSKMKDWKAAVRNWERGDKNKYKTQSKIENQLSEYEKGKKYL